MESHLCTGFKGIGVRQIWPSWPDQEPEIPILLEPGEVPRHIDIALPGFGIVDFGFPSCVVSNAPGDFGINAGPRCR